MTKKLYLPILIFGLLIVAMCFPPVNASVLTDTEKTSYDEPMVRDQEDLTPEDIAEIEEYLNSEQFQRDQEADWAQLDRESDARKAEIQQRLDEQAATESSESSFSRVGIGGFVTTVLAHKS